MMIYSKSNINLKQVLLVSGLLSLVTPAYAAVSFDGELDGNITATSTYLWRGVTQTLGPALQGGVNYSDPTGVHFGLWGSNVSAGTITITPNTTNLSLGGSEIDIIMGYSGKASTLNYDAGLIFYQYPQAPSADFGEVYVGLSQGQISGQLSHSNDIGTYFEIAGTFPIKTWQMTAHFGHYSLKETGAEDYADYHVDFKKPMKDFDVSFMFSNTDLKGDSLRSIISVSKDFKP